VIRKFVPAAVKRAVRRFQEARRRASLFGPLAPLVPPVADMYEGPAGLDEFKANGDEFLAIYKNLCGLRPDERMLDVGSGIGRKTIPLTQYFNASAVYEGIDISKAGIDWCQRRITARYPNFRFTLLDVRNDLYNPSGRNEASEVRFPFANESFTFVMLGSVFTHMKPRDVEHYLHEINRVLAAGQRCLISYFLLNDESRSLIDAGRSTLPFGATLDDFATTSPDMPESAIAYEETFIRSLYARTGFTIARMEYGTWCGRAEGLSYQDLIVATKT